MTRSELQNMQPGLTMRMSPSGNGVPHTCPGRTCLSSARDWRGDARPGLRLAGDCKTGSRPVSTRSCPVRHVPSGHSPEAGSTPGQAERSHPAPATGQHPCHPVIPVTGCTVLRPCWLLRRSAPPCRGSGWIRDSGGPPPLQPAETSGPPWPGHRRPRWPESPCPAPGRPDVPW